MTARVILVEDHPRLRQVISRFIAQEAGLEVVGAAASAEEALKLVAQLEPDLLLVDRTLPDADGLALIRQVKVQWPQVQCIVLNGHEQEMRQQAAQAAGAKALVAKSKPEHLIPTLLQVLNEG